MRIEWRRQDEEGQEIEEPQVWMDIELGLVLAAKMPESQMLSNKPLTTIPRLLGTFEVIN